MSTPWKLKVWVPNTTHANQTDGNAKAIYSNSSPGGIVGGFQWSARPSGNCAQLEFQGSPSDRRGNTRLGIGGRDVIQLQIDDDEDSTFTNVFHGIVVDLPPQRESRLGNYVALGSWKLFEKRTMDERRIEERQDVADFVDDISDLFPVQVAYSTPAATGGELNELYLPGVKVSETLDLLKQSVPGYAWGGNAGGNFLFAEPSGSANIAYSQTRLRFLPITAEDMATKINLIVLNGEASVNLRPGDNYTVQENPFSAGATVLQRQASPMIHSYEDALHSTYLAEQSFIVNSPRSFLVGDPDKYAYTQDATGMNNGANAFDDDLGTFASWDGATANPLIGLRLTGTPNIYEPHVGVRLVYETNVETQLDLSLELDDYLERFLGTISLESGYHDLYIVIPPDDRLRPLTDESRIVLQPANALSGSDQFDVYRIHPLFLDTSALDELAKSLVKLPASVPAEIEVDGYIAPVKTVTVTGMPRGEVSGDVAMWRYSLTPEEGLRTVIDLEAEPEGPDSRVIRLNAQQVTQVSQDSLRMHLTRR